MPAFVVTLSSIRWRMRAISYGSRPKSVEEHSSLLANWTVLPSGCGFIVEESVAGRVRRLEAVPDLTAAETFIATRREEMEARLEAMVRMSNVSHH